MSAADEAADLLLEAARILGRFRARQSDLLDELADSLAHGGTGARRDSDAVWRDLEALAGDVLNDVFWIRDDLRELVEAEPENADAA